MKYGTNKDVVALLRKVLRSEHLSYADASLRIGGEPTAVKDFVDRATREPMAEADPSLIDRIVGVTRREFSTWGLSKVTEDPELDIAHTGQRVIALCEATGKSLRVLSAEVADRNHKKSEYLMAMVRDRTDVIRGRQKFPRELTALIPEITGCEREWLFYGRGPMFAPGHEPGGLLAMRPAVQVTDCAYPKLFPVHIGEHDVELLRDGEEPRIKDLDLARILAFKDIYQIRRLIQRHTAAGNVKPIEVFVTMTNTGGRPGVEYWLTEEDAIFITAHSETPNAVAVTKDVIRVFTLYRKGALPAPVPAPTAPVDGATLGREIAASIAPAIRDLGAAIAASEARLSMRIADLEHQSQPQPPSEPPKPTAEPTAGQEPDELQAFDFIWARGVAIRATEAMTEKNVSREKVAGLMVPPKTKKYLDDMLSAYVKGRTKHCSLATVHNLARAIGCRASWLAFNKGGKWPPPTEP